MDGFDCELSIPPCNPHYDSYCHSVYDNGVCNEGCNTAACNWDGLDCGNHIGDRYSSGSLIIVVGVLPEQFSSMSKDFLRKLGGLLRAVLKIQRDENGVEMVFPWYKSDLTQSRLRRALPEVGRQQPDGTKIHLLIDIWPCLNDSLHECFDSAESAAQFIVAAVYNGWTIPAMPLVNVDSSPDNTKVDPGSPPLNVIYVVVGVALAIVLTLVILVVISRKRARGFTWFPEGFFSRSSDASASSRSSKRHGPDGEELKNIGKNPTDKVDSNDNNTDGWDITQSSKRIKLEEPGETETDDTRQWTSQHLEAANVPNQSIMALTPPTGDELDSKDVDVRGPDGFTPLMLASIRGIGLDSGIDNESSGSGMSGDSEESDERSPEIIRNLLMQGAAINAQTDRTGETSLHLAARYARADAAKALLDAGADPNTQDANGRTPLHTAVAADAQGVFQILLRNRSTNLNARTLDSTTPMILAARLAIEGMVEELINADADINAMDDYGKTALHWAAAVNNAEATLVLLQHGANRDAQDQKDETPLFLAAREGSFETAKILLDHYANREITDQMDRLPRDVAAERLHHDILQLLDEYRVTSPAGMSLHNGIPTSPNGIHAFMHPQKSKSKQRKNKSNGQMKDLQFSPDGTKINGASRKTKTKKKSPGMRGNGPSQCGEGSSIGTLSPGNSVESPNGYDMTPPTYDNVCGQAGNMMGLHHSQMGRMDDVTVSCAQMQNALDDHCVMSNHYQKDSMMNHQQRNMLSNDWMQNQQQQLSRSPLGVPSSIPTPPSSNPSHNSPLSLEGKHSPIKGKSMYPTSPPHYLAMQQHAQRNRPQKSPHHYHIDNYPFSDPQQGHMDNSLSHQYNMTMPISQYPTPPSQHSYLGSDATPPQGHLALPENILTPSPDSPGHWSSSSPHSAQSDWSEGISSPVPPIGQQLQHNPQISGDAVYI